VKFEAIQYASLPAHIAARASGGPFHRNGAGMSWLFLAAAIVFEVCGTTVLKLSEGLTQLIPSLLTVVCYGSSFFLLSLALKKIEVGIAYAIWSGFGTAAIALIGWFWFQESLGMFKLVCIALIIAGVVGLNLTERLAP
jgi:small multidrug resistance pump